MPLPKECTYAAEDYWSLPDSQRAELIDGQFYDMAPPSFKHQKLVSELTQSIGKYIKEHGEQCEVIPAPFAVNLNADDKTYVDPAKERTTVYPYEEDDAPIVIPFNQPVPSQIYPDLAINISELI